MTISEKVNESIIKFNNTHKLENTSPFIRTTKGGKLIIDIEDLNAVNVNKHNYLFLEVLNKLITH